MELKLTLVIYKTISKHCSNRTFMELKLTFMHGYLTRRTVLIVPLWN